jgi:hypothetical protein
MMYVRLAVTVVALATLLAADNSFTIGRRYPGDEEIKTIMEEARGPPDYVLSYSRTYVGDNHREITQVIVEETADSGAYVAIVAGGPGHTYVTLTYTVPRYDKMSYRIKVYGRTPAFRKIP